MIAEERFILVKVKQSHDDDYSKYESDDGKLSKTLSLTDCPDEVKTLKIKKLKSTSSSWKMDFVVGLYFYCKKYNKVNEKENKLQN